MRVRARATTSKARDIRPPVNLTIQIADRIDAVINRIGRLLTWLNLLMMLIVVTIVVMRYCFTMGSVALQESVSYLHATTFMLGIAYTLQHGGHVRVDIFYRQFSPRRRAIIDLSGTLLFLLPVCLLIFFASWDYVLASWSIAERSEERSGIAFVYVLKGLLLLMPALLLTQGFAGALRQVELIFGERGQVTAARTDNQIECDR